MNKKIKIMLANILHLIHKLLVYYVIFGCFLPKKYSKYHYWIWPLIWLHWKTNNNYCIFSQWELTLREQEYLLKTVDKDHQDGDTAFMKILFKELFNIDMTVRKADVLTNTLFTISCLISLYRFTPLLKKNT
jgi:hypothetical protein